MAPTAPAPPAKLKASENNAQAHSTTLCLLYLLVLDDGELKALQPTAELLACHPFRFLRIKLEGEGELPQWIREAVVAEPNGELELRLHQQQHSIGEAIEACRNAGFKVVDVHTREPSLEDAFVALTGSGVDA